MDKKENNKLKKILIFLRKYKLIIIFSLVILTLLICSILYILRTPFELKGTNVKILYGEKYKELGFKAKKYGKDYTKKVKIKVPINERNMYLYSFFKTRPI
mgnify:CR=1 FL=1